MTGVATAAALTLGAAFTWAGVVKVAQPGETTAAFRRLRVPIAPAMARAVPAVELALALLLVTRPRAGGLAAMALLTAFSAFLAVRGHGRVSCGCFGGSRAPRARSAVLARNGMLGVLAVLALGTARPVGPSLPATLAMGSAVCIGAIALALLDLRGAAAATTPWHHDGASA